MQIESSSLSQHPHPHQHPKPPSSIQQQHPPQPQQPPQQQHQTNPLRSLVDKTVFFDINNSYKKLKQLKECLSLIGSKIADCLSKEVNFVITNREKISAALNDSTNPMSPTVNSPSSSLLSDANSLQQQLQQKKIKTSPHGLSLSSRNSFFSSRMQMAIDKTSKTQKSDILSTAQRLGISVLHTNELDRYVEKYLNKVKLLETNNELNAAKESGGAAAALNQHEKLNAKNNSKLSAQLTKKDLDFSNHKIYKLKSPFLKFETICKQYKPIYQEFKEWHDINFDSMSSVKGTNSPFQAYFSEELKPLNGECVSSSENESASYDCNQQSTAGSTTTTKPKPSQSTDLQFKSPTSSNLQPQPPQQQQQIHAVSVSVLNSSQPKQPRLSQTISNNNISGISFRGAVAATAISNTTTTNNINPLATNNNINNISLINLPVNRQQKAIGFCECCKLRFDNLKHHLTSAQHENFDRNAANFAEIDEYVNTKLNFQKFLSSKGFCTKKKTTSGGEKNAGGGNRLSTTSTNAGQKMMNKSRTSLNNTGNGADLTLNMDTSLCNQHVLLEVFNDLTYDVIDKK